MFVCFVCFDVFVECWFVCLVVFTRVLFLYGLLGLSAMFLVYLPMLFEVFCLLDIHQCSRTFTQVGDGIKFSNVVSKTSELTISNCLTRQR